MISFTTPFVTVLAQETTNSFGWTLANTRNLLHLIGVIVWVGGLILMGALMPVAARVSPDSVPKLAKQFSRVAWPAFFFTVLTGLWNLGSNWADSDTSWQVVIFIKLGLVAISGIAAWLHLKATQRSHKMIFAMLTLLLSIAIIVLGVGLGN